MYKPNTTDPEEIVSHLQDANISLADVTCDVVMIGKLQDTCAPFQVKIICSSIFTFHFCTSSAGLVQMDEQRLLDWGAYPHISHYGHSSLHLGSGQEQGQDVKDNCQKGLFIDYVIADKGCLTKRFFDRLCQICLNVNKIRCIFVETKRYPTIKITIPLKSLFIGAGGTNYSITWKCGGRGCRVSGPLELSF